MELVAAPPSTLSDTLPLTVSLVLDTETETVTLSGDPYISPDGVARVITVLAARPVPLSGTV